MRSKDLQELVKDYTFEVAKKDFVELVDDKIIMINKKPSFFYYEKKLVPTLHILQNKNILRKVVVDMGAVKFLISGADVMRPGLKEIDPLIKEGEFVLVVDINHKKALCVAIALFSGEQMQKQTIGKVLKNIHFIGDETWRFS